MTYEILLPLLLSDLSGWRKSGVAEEWGGGGGDAAAASHLSASAALVPPNGEDGFLHLVVLSLPLAAQH